MPALLTKTEFKKRLSEKYNSEISLFGKYVNTMTYAKFIHSCGHKWTTQPQILLYGTRKFGCPKCAREAVKKANALAYKKRLKLKTLSPWTNVTKYYKHIEKLWGDHFNVSGYTGAKSKVSITCNRCGTTWTDRYNFYLNKNPCQYCVSTASHENLNEKTKEFITHAYNELFFNVEQIARLTGFKKSTIRSLLQETTDFINGKLKLGKRSVELLHRGRDVSSASLYKTFNRRLASHVYKRYRTIIDPAGLLDTGPEYHLDHILSIRDGFIRYPEPLDIRLLNHPANLQVLPAKLNVEKNATSWLTRKELKHAARKFEIKYGKVTFPKHFNFKFSRKIDLSDLKGVTIIGLDPGSKNFGVFVGRVYGTTEVLKIEVLHTAMLQHTIHDLTTTTLDRTIERFLDELGFLYDKYLPDLVVVERFQARGIKGSINETVNMMIGMILMQALHAYCEEIPVVRPCTPASWKNKVNRFCDLKELYNEGKQIGLLPHQIDSALMGINQFPAKDSVSFLKNQRIDFLKSLAACSSLVVK